MLTNPRTQQATNSPTALPRVYAWFSALITEDMTLLNDLHAYGVPVDVLHPLRHTTALMEATRLGRTTVIEWLLSHGAAPAFLCGMPLGTPLHSALCRRHWHIAEQLLAHSECTSVLDAYGRTPLHILCMEGHDAGHRSRHLALGEALIARTCPIDALDHEGIAPLHHCVINDTRELAEMLLAQGANVDVLIPDTWVSPLTIAALEKNGDMAKLLLKYGANAQLRTREGSCPATIYPPIAQMLAS